MNAETCLLRQVHPSFIQMNRITSQVFKPRPTNFNRLSAYDGDQISAEAAWQHYTETLGFKSAGIVAITVADCTSQGLQVHPDPQDFPEHVLVDFGGLERRRIETVAKRFRAAAEERGWLYRREESA